MRHPGIWKMTNKNSRVSNRRGNQQSGKRFKVTNIPTSGIYQFSSVSQSCPTLWRILEWVAISFFNAWKWKVKVKSLSRVRLLVTSWRRLLCPPTRLLRPWDFPGKSTGVGCHCLLRRAQLLVSNSVIPWTVADQALVSIEFSRQGCWSELPFPPLGDLPDPGIKPVSPRALKSRLGWQIVFPKAMENWKFVFWRG